MKFPKCVSHWIGAVCVAAVPFHLAAQEQSWPVDPTLPGQVVYQPSSTDLIHYEISVADTVTGSIDHISFDKSTGNWLAIGEDGIVVGGRLARDPFADPPAVQCGGPAILLCIPAGIAAICEIRRNLAVRRAQQQCNATGRGVSVRSQTGCGDVRTECIDPFRPAFHEP